MRDWDEHVANREEAEAEERWLNAERREWVNAVIERLDRELERYNELAERSPRNEYVQGHQDAYLKVISHLREEWE